MIYVDSCIPMYLVGATHPLKTRVIELLPGVLRGGEDLITSAEAFQEIIHRYLALKNWEILNAAYEALERMAIRSLEVNKIDVDLARSLLGQYPNLSSRDALHVAIMKRAGCSKIWTYDKRFEAVSTIRIIS